MSSKKEILDVLKELTINRVPDLLSLIPVPGSNMIGKGAEILIELYKTHEESKDDKKLIDDINAIKEKLSINDDELIKLIKSSVIEVISQQQSTYPVYITGFIVFTRDNKPLSEDVSGFIKELLDNNIESDNMYLFGPYISENEYYLEENALIVEMPIFENKDTYLSLDVIKEIMDFIQRLNDDIWDNLDEFIVFDRFQII